MKDFKLPFIVQHETLDLPKISLTDLFLAVPKGMFAKGFLVNTKLNENRKFLCSLQL